MGDETLLIAETFFSLQGEGKLTGAPSFFVRLSGCNLRCRWCDTPYASWAPEGERRSVGDVVEEARRSGARHAVLTGGEPMIFPQLAPLSQALAGAGMHITVETAGTVGPGERPGLTCDLMSISPKLANSTPSAREAEERGIGAAWSERHELRRINPAALQGLLDAYSPERRQLKFVVASESDLAEIEGLLAKLRGWEPGDVLLMPEGTELPSPERRGMVVRACLERGWRYCHRLHIELFGHTRGT